MPAFLPDAPLLLAFTGASLVLALLPGPAVVYIVARTLAQGRRSGMASVAGVALGNLGNAVAAAFGLAALFAVSAAAFTVVKLIGAAYLIYLGVRLWRDAGSSGHTTDLPAVTPRSERRIFIDGFVVALLNPKTALFFVAFLPQFMSPHAAALPQTLSLGALFTVIAGCTDLGYVLLAALVAPRLQRAATARRTGQRVAGGAFIGLGLLAAFTGRPTR